MKSDIFRGTFPALVTPMGEDKSSLRHHPINEGVMEQLVYYVLDGGCEGVVVAGCTGQGTALEDDERVDLTKGVREVVERYNAEKGTSKLVIAGDGLSTPYKTAKLAQRVENEAQVYNHLMISPSTSKPPQRGLVEHYKGIADNIEGNIIMYSVPGRTGGVGILTDTAVKLAYHPRIVGIKEASDMPERIEATIKRTKDLDFVVLSGTDKLNIHIITELGGDGAISVAANVDPRKTSDSVRYALRGDFQEARKIDNQLQSLYTALFLKDDGNPIMAHYALRRIGYNVGVPRLPLVDALDANKKEMNKALTGLGFALK